jgi:hypothetical protein
MGGHADLHRVASRPAWVGKQTCMGRQADLHGWACRPAWRVRSKRTFLFKGSNVIAKRVTPGPIAPGLGDESIRSKYSFHTTSYGCSPAQRANRKRSRGSLLRTFLTRISCLTISDQSIIHVASGLCRLRARRESLLHLCSLGSGMVKARTSCVLDHCLVQHC